MSGSGAKGFNADIDTDAPVRKRQRKKRVYDRRTTIADVMCSAGGRLPDLPGLLVLEGAERWLVASTVKIRAALPWRKRRVKRLVRAAHSLYRRPHWEHVLSWDKNAPGAPQLGLARPILCEVNGKPCDGIVV